MAGADFDAGAVADVDVLTVVAGAAVVAAGTDFVAGTVDDLTGLNMSIAV